MTSLKSLVALVTGASSGIGAATAERLVKEGATVIGCARNVERIKGLAEKLKDLPGKLDAVQCDLNKEEDILSMFRVIKETYGGLDICINNAGLGKAGKLMDGKTEEWRAMLDLNVLALSICTREALSCFDLKGSAGHILNIGSVAGHVMAAGSSGGHFYCATKWMVRTLTECLRMELQEKGSRTRVSMVSPGLVETEFACRSVGEERGKQIYSQNESLTAEQMADAVYFCLSAADNMMVNDIIVRPNVKK